MLPGDVRLGDFGSAVIVEATLPLTQGNAGVTLEYASPEVLADDVDDASTAFPSDVWSCGATLYWAVTGIVMAERGPRRKALRSNAWTIDNDIKSLPQGSNAEARWLACPQGLREIIRGCLQWDPRDRLTAQLIATCDYVNGLKMTLLPEENRLLRAALARAKKCNT